MKQEANDPCCTFNVSYAVYVTHMMSDGKLGTSTASSRGDNSWRPNLHTAHKKCFNQCWVFFMVNLTAVLPCCKQEDILHRLTWGLALWPLVTPNFFFWTIKNVQQLAAALRLVWNRFCALFFFYCQAKQLTPPSSVTAERAGPMLASTSPVSTNGSL